MECLTSNNNGDDDKRNGFKLESISDTIPRTFDLSDYHPNIESGPEIDTTNPVKVSDIVAIWYFEKNIVYKDFGGIIKIFIKNNDTNAIYVYKIGIKPSWQIGQLSLQSGVFANVGQYIESGEKVYLGMVYFNGPSTSGEYDYRISFSLHQQNDTGFWNDCGSQDASAKKITVQDFPTYTEYEKFYNLPQYYDKINEIVDPTSDPIINLSHEIASNFSGAFNIYQACALFDYVNANIDYFTDPSSTENYWCTPEQTLNIGGDCEDHSTLLASLLIAIGGTVRMYMTDSHAFLGLYIGNGSNIQDIGNAIRSYYGTDLPLFYFEDDLGAWLIFDSVGSIYPGGLPLGGVPVNIKSEDGGGATSSKTWSWGFAETKKLYITDILVK